MYICVGGIDFASSYEFSIRFWNCSDSVVFFAFPIITRTIDLYNKTNTEQIE